MGGTAVDRSSVEAIAGRLSERVWEVHAPAFVVQFGDAGGTLQLHSGVFPPSLAFVVWMNLRAGFEVSVSKLGTDLGLTSVIRLIPIPQGL